MKHLTTPRKTLLIANGEKPDISFFRMLYRESNTLIALDGAAHWLLEHDIRPDVVIGDMDSAEVSDLSGLTIITVPDQNSNDLEKGLSHCLDQGLFDVTILGAFGQRIDHFLTNLFVLKKFASRMNLNMIDAHQCAFICPTHTEVAFLDMKGSFVSFFPLDEQVGPITSTGVAYPLSQEMLSLKSRIGTQNNITTHRATLRCEQGDLLVIVPTKNQGLITAPIFT